MIFSLEGKETERKMRDGFSIVLKANSIQLVVVHNTEPILGGQFWRKRVSTLVICGQEKIKDVSVTVQWIHSPRCLKPRREVHSGDTEVRTSAVRQEGKARAA